MTTRFTKCSEIGWNLDSVILDKYLEQTQAVTINKLLQKFAPRVKTYLDIRP